MPYLPDFEGWAIFAKVAEQGSFSRAAEELGLAKTTVSKAITRLEGRMRTTLLHRTTRKLSLTESGRLSLERALRIMADGTAIEADILEEAAIPRGLVRLAVATGFGEEALAPVLPEFMAAYPEIELEVHLTENRVDVVAEGYDVAIQIGGSEDSQLRISRLFSLRRPLVGAPALIERYGRPTHPEELARFPVIIPLHVPWGSEWEFSGPAGENYMMRMSGRFRVNNTRSMIPALTAGIGIGTVPEFFIWHELQAGILEEMLPGWNLPPGPMFVVTPPGRARPARVRALLDFLRKRFPSEPWAHGVER